MPIMLTKIQLEKYKISYLLEGGGNASRANIGDGYYKGNIDGIFGPETYKAILEYQKSQGLKEDGMWGEDTNSVHRVLNAVNSPYRNDASGSSGAHSGTLSTGPGPYIKRNTQEISDNEYYRRINALKQRFYGDGGEEWFWGDSPEASQWRQHLYKTDEGNAILDEFYGNTSEQMRNKIDYKKLADRYRQDRMGRNITSGTNNAAEFIALKAAPAIALPLAAASAPIATLAGTVGSIAGSKLAGYTSDNLHSGDTRSWTSTDVFGNIASNAMPAENYYRPGAEVIGGTIGGLVGAYGSQFLGRPDARGLQWRDPDGLPEPKFRKIRSDYGQKRSSYTRHPKPEKIPVLDWLGKLRFGNGQSVMSSEVISKKQGGIIPLKRI